MWQRSSVANIFTLIEWMNEYFICDQFTVLVGCLKSNRYNRQNLSWYWWACSPQLMHKQVESECVWNLDVLQILKWSVSRISRSIRFRNLGCRGIEDIFRESQKVDGICSIFSRWSCCWSCSRPVVCGKKDRRCPCRISGKESERIAFGAALFRLLDKDEVDVRKWIEALFEWGGTQRYLFRNLV